MELTELTYPNNHTPLNTDDPRVDTWYAWAWANPELCNNCFTQVRDIGDKRRVARSDWFMEINAFYERTERGSQEHDPYTSAANRFGQCYCLECGSDLSAQDNDLSIPRMLDRLGTLADYIDQRSPLDFDRDIAERTIRDLKAVHDNGGYDTEIFCVAFCRAVGGRIGQRPGHAHATA